MYGNSNNVVASNRRQKATSYSGMMSASRQNLDSKRKLVSRAQIDILSSSCASGQGGMSRVGHNKIKVENLLAAERLSRKTPET